MLTSAEARFRVAQVVRHLAPERHLNDQEKDDLDQVIAQRGNVDKQTRRRMHAMALEDLFEEDLESFALPLSQDLRTATGNVQAPLPPPAHPELMLVEYVEYMRVFGV